MVVGGHHGMRNPVLRDHSIRKVETPALIGKGLWAHLVWNLLEVSKMSQLISLENLLKN